MSDTKKNWLDKTGVIHLWNTIKALLDTKVDKIEGLGLSSNDYTVEDKTKVSKIKPVQNTLTSTDTEAGLSAAQGKVLKDIVDTKADNINVQPITIPTTGWGTENGVSSYPNYIDIPLAGVSSKDAVVIDISPSSAYFAAQAQFTNTESMEGAVRIRAKNVPTAAIKGQWYVIHGGGTVYEGELRNYYDKSEMESLLVKKADKDVILDSDGNVIFYSKTAVDTLLAGKLDLSGGAMTGPISMLNAGDYVLASTNTVAGRDSLISIKNEADGITIAFGIGNGGKTFGIVNQSKSRWPIAEDFETGNLYLDADKIFFRGHEDPYVVASGSNYVRFGDGTQICWGTIQSTVTFPIAFATTSYSVGMSNSYAKSSFGQATTPYITKRTATNMEISIADYGDSYIAIGRWK